MSLEPFPYKPLTEHDSFRLLEIQPSSTPTADIHCRLLHITLSHCSYEIIDHYTALSYVWGDASNRRMIFVDDHPVSITASLEAAFRDLRDETRVLRIWADALCIDQSNTDERNSQVRLMGDIYSTAQHTVIHLGSLSEAARTVLNAVQSRGSGGLDLATTIDMAKRDVLTLPWFSRVWIFQELILSRDQWVQCGRLRVRWTGFCGLLLTPNPSQLLDDASSSSLRVLADMERLRGGRSAGSLLGLLKSRRGLGATDPRDMVFAHMGIASDRDGWNNDLIRVDYRKTCKQVYEDVTLYFLQTIGPETFFVNLNSKTSDDLENSNGSPQGIHELASWAPDWSLPASYTLSMYQDDLLSIRYLKAGRYLTFLKDERILAMMGYEVDIISDISFVLPTFRQMKSSERTEYQKAVNDLRALYQKVGGTYWSGDERGRYARIDLRGREEEHRRLCNQICDGWIHIMECELPILSSKPDTNELNSSRKFVEGLKTWLRAKAQSGCIFTGQNCQGLISLLDCHLMPSIDKSVLDGRRLATTQKGSIAVVPADARSGDVVAYLAGNAISVAIRHESDSGDKAAVAGRIREAFVKKDLDEKWSGDTYVSSFAELFKTNAVPVMDYSLVGECYVDGRVSWAVGESHEHCIFAFR